MSREASPAPEPKMSENAVSIKLPTFWSQQPKVWFAQTEAQFSIRNITEEVTKFHYVVSALDQETAVRVLDIIQEVPAKTPYTTLKTRLLGTFTPSDYERAGQLLHIPPLGDNKPSYLMDQMMALLPTDHKPCFLFRRIFLERMPERIRSILLHAKITDARELADAADRLHEAHSMEESAPGINKVTQKADKKEKKKRSDYCFYHARFGKKAHRCEQPCAWPAENAQAGPQ